jgi:hypothetical protein
MTLANAELPKYDDDMTDRPKVKRTVTLDAELVEFVGEGNLSGEVNEALRARLHRRRQNASLKVWLDEMDAEYGAPPEDEVRRWIAILGGDPDSL